MISHNFNLRGGNLPILHSSNPLAISQKLLTKTSQIFQSSTFGYAILRKLLTKTSNPPLLVTQSYENFWRKLPILSQSYGNFSKLPNFYTLPILHFWLRNLTKTSYKNFSKLLTKTSQNFQSSTFGYENFLPKLLKTSKPPLFVTKTSNSSSFRYENFRFLHFWLRKLLSQTSDSSTLVTKT